MRTILNNKPLLWLILALPAAVMLRAWLTGTTDAPDLLHPSGEFSARLMIVAMTIAPLIAVIGSPRWLRWLLARRRALGVAAFGYAMLHLVFYVVDMGVLADMLAEVGAPGIWTGWLAFAFMIPLALTSNDAAMRTLRAGWKRLQRLAYPAAALTLVHWVLIHNNAVAALVHFAPLMILLVIRLVRSPANLCKDPRHEDDYCPVCRCRPVRHVRACARDGCHQMQRRAADQVEDANRAY